MDESNVISDSRASQLALLSMQELASCINEIKRRMVEEPNKSELEAIIAELVSVEARKYTQV
jgi:hypothetical protein